MESDETKQLIDLTNLVEKLYGIICSLQAEQHALYRIIEKSLLMHPEAYPDVHAIHEEFQHHRILELERMLLVLGDTKPASYDYVKELLERLRDENP